MAPTAADSSEMKDIHILHFNDVYNIESSHQEPVGGAARFCTALKSFSHLNPLILFSGDIFAPSFMSTFTKGEQMIPVINACGVHCSVYGNHDFDFGIDVLVEQAKKTGCPWLMSNVIDNETNRPLAEGKGSLIMDWQGISIGLIGLVEKEWLDTLAAIDPGHVTYTDYVECGRALARNLKDEQGCSIVIALTHMRTPNDQRLLEEVEEIDLVLGGHDHVSEYVQVNNRCLIKSGTDFRQFSHIVLRMNGEKPMFDVNLIDVSSAYEEDQELKTMLESYTSVISEKMDEVLGIFSVPLDGRFSSVRTSETNLGNFICDVMIAAMDADLALLNSGTLRSDRIHPAGPFTLRDLHNILPMLDPLIVLEITGEQLIATLENSVSQYPKLEGRFLQVGGMSFAFDPTKPSGSRVDPRFVRIGDQYLELDSKYRMVTKSYMHAGKDGYEVLTKTNILVDEESSTSLTTAVQNHFQSIQSLRGKSKRQTRHRQSLITLSRRHSLARTLECELLNSAIIQTPAGGGTRLRRRSSVEAPNLPLLISQQTVEEDDVPCRKPPRLRRQSSIEEVEMVSCKLEPQIENRIVVITEASLRELIAEKMSWESNITTTIQESIEN